MSYRSNKMDVEARISTNLSVIAVLTDLFNLTTEKHEM